MFYAIDIFAGAGGLSLGLKNAGFKVILANDIDQDCVNSFKINHPNVTTLCDDIHNISFEFEVKKLGLPQVDLLAGGPPCQGFSTVGAKNEDDIRNSLFYEYLRVVEEVKPSYILFENVSGFTKMYKGKAFIAINNKLKSLGYLTKSSILDASDYGLPQIRQRTIIVGWKKDFREVNWPMPTHGTGDLFKTQNKVTLMDAISDLPALNSHDSKNKYQSAASNEYQQKLRDNKKILTEHSSSNYGDRMLKIMSLIPEGGDISDVPETLRPKKYFSNTYARLFPNKPSPTITRNFGTPSSSRCIHPYQNRALSTREGARLQGFPDNYNFCGSKTSKNLQIGNAVPVLLGEVIAKEIFVAIKQSRLDSFDQQDEYDEKQTA